MAAHSIDAGNCLLWCVLYSDDLYAFSWETDPGGYVRPPWDMRWLNAAEAYGLKVVGILAPNWHYRDKYDPLAMSNLAAWIAQTGLVTAFEVPNEPNNDYASYEGPTCETKLVPLTNVVTAAVHAVNPSIQVNGLERAGSANFQHAGKGNHDEWCGLSPYANGNYIPETTYEWQYLGYGSWIQALDSETSLPKWENRMGGRHLGNVYRHESG